MTSRGRHSAMGVFRRALFGRLRKAPPSVRVCFYAILAAVAVVGGAVYDAASGRDALSTVIGGSIGTAIAVSAIELHLRRESHGVGQSVRADDVMTEDERHR